MPRAAPVTTATRPSCVMGRGYTQARLREPVGAGHREDVDGPRVLVVAEPRDCVERDGVDAAVPDHAVVDVDADDLAEADGIGMAGWDRA